MANEVFWFMQDTKQNDRLFKQIKYLTSEFRNNQNSSSSTVQNGQLNVAPSRGVEETWYKDSRVRFTQTSFL